MCPECGGHAIITGLDGLQECRDCEHAFDEGESDPDVIDEGEYF
jgi:ribosomal protein L37AE/L43A